VRISFVTTATLSFCDNYSFDPFVLPEFLSYLLFLIPEMYEAFLIIPEVAKYD
jgi:hypothetical protein